MTFTDAMNLWSVATERVATMFHSTCAPGENPVYHKHYPTLFGSLIIERDIELDIANKKTACAAAFVLREIADGLETGWDDE